MGKGTVVGRHLTVNKKKDWEFFDFNNRQFCSCRKLLTIISKQGKDKICFSLPLKFKYFDKIDSISSIQLINQTDSSTKQNNCIFIRNNHISFINHQYQRMSSHFHAYSFIVRAHNVHQHFFALNWRLSLIKNCLICEMVTVGKEGL